MANLGFLDSQQVPSQHDFDAWRRKASKSKTGYIGPNMRQRNQAIVLIFLFLLMYVYCFYGFELFPKWLIQDCGWIAIFCLTNFPNGGFVPNDLFRIADYSQMANLGFLDSYQVPSQHGFDARRRKASKSEWGIWFGEAKTQPENLFLAHLTQ